MNIYAATVATAYEAGSATYRKLSDERDALIERLRTKSSTVPRWRAELTNVEMALALAAPDDAAAMYWFGVSTSRPLQIEDSGVINQDCVRAMFAKAQRIKADHAAAERAAS